MDPYIGQIQAFGFDFPPQGWAACNGQLLPINQNQALFALLGTTYGGNGTTTFALPDLRGRCIRHFGTGNGLPNIVMGQRAGAQSVTLTTANMAPHNHNVRIGVNTAAGDNSAATNNCLANSANTYAEDSTPNAFLGGVTDGSAGSSVPVNIRNPYLVVNVCIALVGIFPSRN